MHSVLQVSRYCSSEVDVVQQDKNSLLVLGLGIGLGVLGMLLTFFGTVGIGVAVFFLAWVVVILLHARWQSVKPQKYSLLLLVPLIFSALMLAIRSDASLGTLNIMTFLAAGLLFAFYFNGGNLLATSLVRYVVATFESGVEVVFRPFAEWLNSLKWVADRRGQWQKLMPIVRGLAITAPIVAVFVVLFGSADAVFGKYLTDFMNLFSFNLFDELGFRVGYAAVIGWLAIGTLSVSLVDHSEKRKQPPTPQAEDDSRAEAIPEVSTDAPLFRLGLIETTMVLGGVCGVFLLFVLVQGVYLFGGASNIANFSYAEYLHRGFAELVVIAVLSLGLIYGLKMVTGTVETQRHKLFRGLATLLMLLTGIVLVSAFQRLRLYELTYGFTSLRLTIYITIGWLGVLLVGMIASLYWSPRTIRVFETAVLVSVFGFSITHSLINPDAFVAWQNINRGDVDPVYLSSLSNEAIPELLPLLDSPEPGVRVIVAERLRYMLPNEDWRSADWRMMNLRDYSLMTLLASPDLKAKVVRILANDEPQLFNKRRLDNDLKLGMSVREVTRQFGAPAWASSYEGRLEENSTIYGLTYFIDTTNSLRLVMHFDTADGLRSAEICDDKEVCKQVKG